MSIQRSESRPLGNTIKLMDSGGNVSEVRIADLGSCILERYMLGVKLAQNVVLEDNDASRSWILRMARNNMMVFKIVE
jgi:hypothetical protein